MTNRSTDAESDQKAVHKADPTSRAVPVGYNGPSSRFQDELDAVVRSATDEDSLRMMIVECLFRHRELVGVGWYATDGQSVEVKNVKFNNPALEHKPVQDWISASCVSANQSGHDIVSNSANIRNLAIVAAPIVGLEQPEVLSVLLANPNTDRIEIETLAARSVIRAVGEWLRVRQLKKSQGQLRITAALLELNGRLEQCVDTQQAARILADSLHEYLKCDFVAVGLCRAGRKTVKLRAISGIGDLDASSGQARRIKAAIDESIVRRDSTVFRTTGSSEHQLLAHRKLAESGSSDVVMSTPLITPDGDIVGGVVFTGKSTLDRTDAIGLLNTLAQPVAGALQVVQRAQRGFLRRSFGRIVGGNAFAKTIASAAVLLAIGFVLCIPFPYRIACRFQVEPVERRYCVAPYDGLLRETYAEPGDTITAGQVLATMDDAEMRFELAGLVADSHRAKKKRDVHLADEEVADSYMAALEADRIDSRSMLLEHRLESLTIVSPVSGIVLSGGTERRENYPVTIGQTVYEVAPLNKVVLQVGVPASEVDHVQPDMKVEFRLDSDPSEVHVGRVKRIRPRSEIVDDQNVFVAEVEFENAKQKLRPGMEGAARVVGASHSLAWNLFHRAYDYAVSTWFW